FVSARNHQFYLNDIPQYYIGTNYWYGELLALEKDKSKGIDRLRKELDFLKQHGVTNLRLVAGAEGSGLVNGVVRIGPPLQPEEGIFDPKILKGLDVLLDEMGKRNMKAVIYLSNNWEWSGGFLQYLKWNNLIPDSVFKRKFKWNELGDYISEFYDCKKCRDDYEKQAAYILDHVNSVSKIKYKDDPAIMAWELANEPRPMKRSSIESYEKWISSACAFIKSKDSNHLVTLGVEGYMGTENLNVFEKIHDNKNVDYLTIHVWPKNWSWFKGNDVAGGIDSVFSNSLRYIDAHEQVAGKLNKPLVIEEFGLPRNNNSFDINASTSLRDSFYNRIFTELIANKNGDGVLAGVNFWAYGGLAKPIPGQTYWKPGDEYMGDPPMEEQGLNTVFNSDKSTWEVIDSAAIHLKNPASANELPSDKNATKETAALYHNLKSLLLKGTMFGHQDDLAYGVGWKYIPGKSDVRDVTGAYPAVYGFELGRLEIDQPVNIDTVPFDKIKSYIYTIYERGGVVTLSWHLNNPLTGKTAWDPAPGTVASILPGGEKNDLYKSWLDKIAGFILSLKGKDGEYIPVIFRPFHELNGNWFWWGKDHCTPEEYKQLWHFTISYLRDVKNVHQLLYAYNTDKFYSKEEYLLKYPGDEWADILGFDIYQRKVGIEGNEGFIKDADNMLTMLEQISFAKNKIPALTEFGYGKVPDSTWWTNVLLKAIGYNRISYALAWRNAGKKQSGDEEYYLPFKGHASENDFIKFYNEPNIFFQKNITKEQLYK
ncbi:MAG: cellulase family glycosylhydrolase, partial [Bacteroidota bacterium]|nr:cellulase family glycosylhydrolase [Bacteroidota bacterium]